MPVTATWPSTSVSAGYGINIDLDIDYGGGITYKRAKIDQIRNPSQYVTHTDSVNYINAARTGTHGKFYVYPWKYSGTEAGWAYARHDNGRWCNVLWADDHISSVMNPGWQGGPGWEKQSALRRRRLAGKVLQT